MLLVGRMTGKASGIYKPAAEILKGFPFGTWPNLEQLRKSRLVSG